ncbi:MAG: Dyp-type peroxidase [Acidimicrobiia bacterium]|nr:Dyp-type peroxidase [Acidimicrobiia bacterium]
MSEKDKKTGITRRSFLRTGGAAAVGASAGFAGVRLSGDPDGQLESSLLPFRGDHQAGVSALAAPAGIVAAFDVRVDGRAELAALMEDLGEIIEQGMDSRPYHDRDTGFPPVDTGLLGPDPPPTSTGVVVGLGHSLFDGRFGLAEQAPSQLLPMPKFKNDYLVRPERSHGDLAFTIRADSSDAAVHMLRQIRRNTRGRLLPRWMQEGFNRIERPVEVGRAPVRNLMGFKDGTSNIDPGDRDAMDRLVWVQPEDDEPEWTVGGTYQATRIIRMMVEFWDRIRLSEQESIFGRHRDSGAPLGKDRETDEPSIGDELTSHIARANPRTAGADEHRILRHSFNYSNGLDGNDQLEQGLIFIAYQRSLEAGFLTVQRHLDGEPLEEYIRPLGGGFFFVPSAPAWDDPTIAADLFA